MLGLDWDFFMVGTYILRSTILGVYITVVHIMPFFSRIQSAPFNALQ